MRGCPLCPRCMEAEETVMHAIFSCNDIAMLWFQFPLGLSISNIQEAELTDWLREFIKREATEAVELLATLAHGVWLAPNKICFE